MKKKFFKTFFISFLAFVVLYSGVVYYLLNRDNGATTGSNSFIDRLTNGEDKDEITFLLLGIDTEDVSKVEKVRSDTMMLFKADKSTGKISILSLPRDTKVGIRGRKHEEKITHAHAYGGPELSVKTVKDLLGIDLEYYVRVDYKLVDEFVEILGGVEVDVPMNMRYDDPTADPPLHINLKKGVQVLDGDKAMQFLRFRKGYADQDLGRIKAQQQFLKACMEKALRPSNIVKVPQMVNTYYKYVDTNIPLDILMQFGLKAKSFSTENMETATLPGEPKTIGGVAYYIADKEQSDELVRNMFIEHKTVENKTTESN